MHRITADASGARPALATPALRMAELALFTTYLNLGGHASAIYGKVGLAIGCFSFRRERPLLLSASVRDAFCGARYRRLPDRCRAFWAVGHCALCRTDRRGLPRRLHRCHHVETSVPRPKVMDWCASAGGTVSPWMSYSMIGFDCRSLLRSTAV